MALHGRAPDPPDPLDLLDPPDLPDPPHPLDLPDPPDGLLPHCFSPRGGAPGLSRHGRDWSPEAFGRHGR
ncbi:MAG: hypothetical protein DMF99_03780 [Acidobacteria bacterium]|nr:MAG: hypothetical protein DMG03_14800 [Acidobacteriota bacterium]PYR12640.1 MAG: hypothetical protein DMF99_03780 [Acidobacteriota bacterium]